MSVAPPPAEPGRSPVAFRPYVDDSSRLPELTWQAVGLGALLGIIFGASSLYLSLKVGLTVSASIPVAVLSIGLFRAMGRGSGKILENNIAQTTGSAGESIAFGIGVTMPALMILGYDLELTRVMLVACLGGLLGILMMIPLRRAFVVNQHGTLPYPEGTACAKILVAGEEGGAGAKTVAAGFGLAFVYQVMMDGLKLWKLDPAHAFRAYRGGVVSLEVSPTLLGVGYIIGSKIAATMVAGGLLSAMVLTPAFAMADPTRIAADPEAPAAYLKAMQTLGGDIRNEYILYIGAGAVTTGGLISLIQSLPLIGASLSGALRDVRGKRAGDGTAVSIRRTDRDLPIWAVFVGGAGLIAVIAGTSLFPTELPGKLAGAALVVLFGFLFVTVSSRLTGEIGSSSNPISGMTVATLLLTCLAFVSVGWVGPDYRLAALSIAGIVCVAASNGGTTSQDLKTGFLVGATPSSQQIAILIGAFSSAIAIGAILLVLNDAGTIYSNKPENLPDAVATFPPKPEVEVGPDGMEYQVWRVTEAADGVKPGKYLANADGKVAYLVDPAINGRLEARDDGTRVTKYQAPKATLMALIIDGIMSGRLPWGKVILGVFIAIVLHLSGVPALAFAVGVYLPISTTMPIFVGGLVRSLIERSRRGRSGDPDSSPAVLLASGYIAGGAIAGILVAILAVIPGAATRLDLSTRLPEGWAEASSPSLIAFGILTAVLALVGAGVLFRGEAPPAGVVEGLVARDDEE